MIIIISVSTIIVRQRYFAPWHYTRNIFLFKFPKKEDRVAWIWGKKNNSFSGDGFPYYLGGSKVWFTLWSLVVELYSHQIFDKQEATSWYRYLFCIKRQGQKFRKSNVIVDKYDVDGEESLKSQSPRRQWWKTREERESVGPARYDNDDDEEV